jgi:hypothetical protein
LPETPPPGKFFQSENLVKMALGNVETPVTILAFEDVYVIFSFRVGTGALSLSSKDFHSTLRHGRTHLCKQVGFLLRSRRRAFEQASDPLGQLAPEAFASRLEKLDELFPGSLSGPIAGVTRDDQPLLWTSKHHSVEVVDGGDQHLRVVRQCQRHMVENPPASLRDEPDNDDPRAAPETSPPLLSMQGGCAAPIIGAESILHPLPRTVRHCPDLFKTCGQGYDDLAASAD